MLEASKAVTGASGESKVTHQQHLKNFRLRDLPVSLQSEPPESLRQRVHKMLDRKLEALLQSMEQDLASSEAGSDNGTD